MFTDATSERTERMFHYLDPDNTGYIDYLGWSQTIKLQVDMLTLAAKQLGHACCCDVCSSTHAVAWMLLSLPQADACHMCQICCSCSVPGCADPFLP